MYNVVVKKKKKGGNLGCTSSIINETTFSRAWRGSSQGCLLIRRKEKNKREEKFVYVLFANHDSVQRYPLIGLFLQHSRYISVGRVRA